MLCFHGEFVLQDVQNALQNANEWSPPPPPAKSNQYQARCLRSAKIRSAEKTIFFRADLFKGCNSVIEKIFGDAFLEEMLEPLLFPSSSPWWEIHKERYVENPHRTWGSKQN